MSTSLSPKDYFEVVLPTLLRWKGPAAAALGVNVLFVVTGRGGGTWTIRLRPPVAGVVAGSEWKADLHITDVKPSCGCTAPEYDKTIKPGAEGKIVLNVDTKTFQGPISKSALILTDDPEKPQITPVHPMTACGVPPVGLMM